MKDISIKSQILKYTGCYILAQIQSEHDPLTEIESV